MKNFLLYFKWSVTKTTMLYLIDGDVINTTITLIFSGQWLGGWWSLGWVVSFLLGWLIDLSPGLQKKKNNC